jgi:serine O-acetyltransferase
VIESRADLRAYLEADRVALRVEHTLKNLLLDDVWRFQRSLRRLEFRLNSGANPALLTISKLRHRRLSRMLGFTIPPNVFGPGLSISHHGTIVVHSDARIGARCRIHPGVMVGSSHGADPGVPAIGDDCYLGSGAKLFGGIEIGSGTIVGANAVVNRSFPEGNVTIAGAPARVIGDREALTLDSE